jgi:5-methylcytosine-specific restriction endonuclease McrA
MFFVMTNAQRKRKREKDRAYYAANRDVIIARARAWYLVNKERHAEGRRRRYDQTQSREYNRQYREAKSEKLRAYEQQRSQTPKRKLYNKRHAARNSAKNVLRATLWAKTNQAKARLNAKNTAGRRRARILSRPFETIDPIKVYKINEGLCGLCHRPVSIDTFELDHIVPIAKGGGHLYANVHIAHRSCNKKKGADRDAIIYSL